MALPELRGTGRLLTDPRTGTGKNDTPWSSTLIKFSSWRKVDGNWEEGDGAVASVIAFEDTAPLLASHAKGDEVGIHGTVKPAIWKNQPQLAITATQIWTPEKAARGETEEHMSVSNAAKVASATLRQVTASRSPAQ